VFGKIREKLAIITCNYFFDGFKGKRDVEIEGFFREVFVFKADYIQGMNSPWGLMLNEKLFENEFEELRELTFLHEIGHEKSSLLIQIPANLRFLLFPSTLFIGFLTALMLILVPSVEPGFTNYLKSGQVVELFQIFTGLYLSAPFFSYLSELQAEFFAIDRIGIDKFQEAMRNAEEIHPEKSLLRRITIRLSHPSPEFTVKAYRLWRGV
jgi:hypothetical protein